MNEPNFEFRKTVVKALTGSHNYNLNTPKSDEDFKYFVAPTFDDLYFNRMFATSSQSETMDYDAHDVRKLAELVWKANVNFIEVLFSKNVWWANGLNDLFTLRNRWATMNLPGFRNATYGTHKQKMGSLLKGTATTQPDVEKFGYDPKQACHAVRCLYVLEDYARTQNMAQTLWYPDNSERRETLLKLKAGYYTLDSVYSLVEGWHTVRKNEVMAFYDAQEARPEDRDEMNEIVYKFVKASLE